MIGVVSARRRMPSRVRLPMASLVVSFAASLCLMGGVAAQDTPTEPTRVSPGASTRVWIMAAFDDKCLPIAPPRIEITVKPAKGNVSFREGQVTTVKSSRSGTCIGARVTGTGVYYTANGQGDGADGFTIEARLPTGEIATRSFKMTITD